MDFLIGITGKDFTLVAADKMAARSILVMKSDQEKMLPLGDHTIILLAGEQGDCTNFGEYIQANVRLYAMKNGTPLSTHAIANFTRGELAKSIRSRSPYQCQVLIGGYEGTGEAVLYWLDYLGTMTKVPFAAHGYGSNFTLGLLDRKYKPDITLDEAVSALKACFAELKTRFLINLSDYTVRVVDKDGVRDVAL
eukprot:comp9335_c0_seq1/m.4414 comp9335_c0_seq1/g.4414  ORF comp9335_c0_seq1/g.4414 comp9335_c0_seq1/m.4414 type:complete len:194 (-) comp9335_c0_seq1:67-648(-)